MLVELGLEQVELAGARSLPAAVDELLPGGGAVESLDGMQAPAQVAGDLAEPPPFGAQPVDQGVVPLGALGVLPVGAGLAFRFRQRRALFFQGDLGCNTAPHDRSHGQHHARATRYFRDQGASIGLSISRYARWRRIIVIKTLT